MSEQRREREEFLCGLLKPLETLTGLSGPGWAVSQQPTEAATKTRLSESLNMAATHTQTDTSYNSLDNTIFSSGIQSNTVKG